MQPHGQRGLSRTPAQAAAGWGTGDSESQALCTLIPRLGVLEVGVGSIRAEGRSVWGGQRGPSMSQEAPERAFPAAGLPQPPNPGTSSSRAPSHLCRIPWTEDVGSQASPGWQCAGPPGVLCLGPGSAALSHPVLSLQTSNPIEVTGRASAVHTLLQKAPGVGGRTAHPSLLGSPQPAQPPLWIMVAAAGHGHPQPPDLTLPSPLLTGVRPVPDRSQGECAGSRLRMCACVLGREGCGWGGLWVPLGWPQGCPRRQEPGGAEGRGRRTRPGCAAECVACPVTEPWEVVCRTRADRLADIPPSAEDKGEPLACPAGRAGVSDGAFMHPLGAV